MKRRRGLRCLLLFKTFQPVPQHRSYGTTHYVQTAMFSNPGFPFLNFAACCSLHSNVPFVCVPWDKSNESGWIATMSWLLVLENWKTIWGFRRSKRLRTTVLRNWRITHFSRWEQHRIIDPVGNESSDAFFWYWPRHSMPGWFWYKQNKMPILAKRSEYGG